MTSEWDNIQEFMGALATIKDPDLYRTGLEYLGNIFGDIHEFDHRHNQMIAKYLFRQHSYERLRKLLKEAREQRKK